jgi:hypothetical protein
MSAASPLSELSGRDADTRESPFDPSGLGLVGLSGQVPQSLANSQFSQYHDLPDPRDEQHGTADFH